MSTGCDDHDECQRGPCKRRGRTETGREYAKRIKERDDAADQRWTSREEPTK